MYTVETKQGPINIAESSAQCVDSLFTSGGTVTNYVIKRSQSFIDLFILGETYRLNRHGVFCLMTKLDNGRNWFSYGGKFNAITGLIAQADLSRDLLREVNK